MKRYTITVIAVISILTAGTGCKKYLDINKNPNVAQDVPVEMLLSSSEIYIGSAMGVDMQVNGGIWAQYWTQAPSSSQYKEFEQYSPTANTYDRVWPLFYSSALEDLQQIEAKATQQNKKEYVAVAKILKAYVFQVVTDAWGDIPFSQALKGLPDSGTVISPKYDAQQQVYAGIIKLIDDGRTLLKGLTTQTVSDDIIYGGDMEKWYEFANTLELKVYLRLSEKDPATAQAGIAALYANDNLFIGDGVQDDAQINYFSTALNQNPLYSEMSGLGSTQNLVASATVVDSMNANNDYRVYVFFDALANGVVVGIPQGGYTLPPSTAVSKPAAVTGANAGDANSALAPVKFITSYESKFLQAEAVARGWGAGDDAQLYMDGIRASLDAYNQAFTDMDAVLADYPYVSINGDTVQGPIVLNPDYAYYSYFNGDTLFGNPASYWSQYPATGTIQEKVKFIITQKWFSMTGNQGFEAWTEWRRTGYPDFFTYSINSIIGNKFPRAFLYPNVELTRNQNFPGQRVVTNKVWWDIH